MLQRFLVDTILEVLYTYGYVWVKYCTNCIPVAVAVWSQSRDSRYELSLSIKMYFESGFGHPQSCVLRGSLQQCNYPSGWENAILSYCDSGGRNWQFSSWHFCSLVDQNVIGQNENPSLINTIPLPPPAAAPPPYLSQQLHMRPQIVIATPLQNLMMSTHSISDQWAAKRWHQREKKTSHHLPPTNQWSNKSSTLPSQAGSQKCLSDTNPPHCSNNMFPLRCVRLFSRCRWAKHLTLETTLAPHIS